MGTFELKNDEYAFSGLTLELREEYDDFSIFIEKTRDPIYRAIINAFKNLEKTEKISLTIKSNVADTEFKTAFEYSKNNADILKDIINPYFEMMEDYETCAEIMNLYSNLIKN
jgi:predicted DNA-binding protein